MNVFRYELQKLLMGRGFWIALGVGTLGSIFAIEATYMGIRNGNPIPVSVVAITLSLLAGMTASIMVSAGVAQEYSFRTLAQVVSQGVGRTQWLVARLVVGLLVLVVAVFIPAVVALILDAVHGHPAAAMISGKDSGLGFLLLTLKGFYARVPYQILGVMLAVTTRSVAAAVSVPLVSMLAVEPIINALKPRVGEYLPSILGNALSTASGHDVQRIVLWLGVYILGFSALAIVRLRKQNLGG